MANEIFWNKGQSNGKNKKNHKIIRMRCVVDMYYHLVYCETDYFFAHNLQYTFGNVLL